MHQSFQFRRGYLHINALSSSKNQCQLNNNKCHVGPRVAASFRHIVLSKCYGDLR